MPEKMDITVDWDLEDPLEAIFSNAIKKVVDLGYKQETTEMTDSRKSLYTKGDFITTIVNDTLKNLKGEVGETSADFVFQSLQQLLHFTLEEMIGKILEQSRSITLNEAKEWSTCDLNVAQVIGEEDKLRCVVSSEPNSSNYVSLDENEQIWKLTSRAQELEDEVQRWSKWANKKVMQITDKLHKSWAESKSLKEKVETYRKERKALEERVMEDNKRQFENAIEDNKRKLLSSASSIFILEINKSWLEKGWEAVESLAEKAKEDHQQVQARTKEIVQEDKSFATKKVLIKHELAKMTKQLSDVKEQRKKFDFNTPYWVKKKNKQYKEAKNMYGKAQAELLQSKRDSELENMAQTGRELLDIEINRLDASILRLKDAKSLIETENLDMHAHQEKLKAQCQQAQHREDKAIQQAESLAKKRDLVEEELENEKLKLSKLQEEIEKEEKQLFYAEAKVKEERAKTEKILALAAFIIKEREQREALMKVEEDVIKKRVASELQKYVESMVKIENEMDMIKLRI